MDPFLRVLQVDAATGFYRMLRFPVGEFFGPVDLGLHLSGLHDSLNIGAGLLAGSIFPGSNRLVISGFSPCWGGFYISSMGGAALVFDNLGLNLVSIVGRARSPSILALNRVHGEEIQVTLVEVDLWRIWHQGSGGVYSMMAAALDRFGEGYPSDPRVLAVGPAALRTDFGAIASAPVVRGRLTPVDTWAGRGGLGSKLLRDHGIAAVVYGGSFVDEDFRDRNVANEWFQDRYQKKLMAKDMEATVKYRFDPAFNTGGTFGVNFATVGGRIIAFNYRSIFMTEDERLAIHRNLVVDHFLQQFNQETIATKNMATCGEPCPAVCKKMRAEYKKDYEPYQTMGPLCGVFDQRAAERLTHRADMLGLDAISAGGVLAWLMEGLSDGLLSPGDLDVASLPVFRHHGFSVESDSMHNAELGIALLDSIIERRGVIDLTSGVRHWVRTLGRDRASPLFDRFLHTGFAHTGWMVPNQYWTPGVLAPMPIMGKYYNHYGAEFLPPRELGRRCASRLVSELLMDNLGMCRFHRGWAEDMLPEIFGSLFGLKTGYLNALEETARRINSRNASVPWLTQRNRDFVRLFLRRRHDVDGDRDPNLLHWISEFERDDGEAGLAFWFEILKGVHESLAPW